MNNGPSPDFVVSKNVELKFPLHIDKILNMLSAATGKTKLALYREAIVEYAERHKNDIVDVVKRGA